MTTGREYDEAAADWALGEDGGIDDPEPTDPDEVPILTWGDLVLVGALLGVAAIVIIVLVVTVIEVLT